MRRDHFILYYELHVAAGTLLKKSLDVVTHAWPRNLHWIPNAVPCLRAIRPHFKHKLDSQVSFSTHSDCSSCSCVRPKMPFTAGGQPTSCTSGPKAVPSSISSGQRTSSRVSPHCTKFPPRAFTKIRYRSRMLSRSLVKIARVPCCSGRALTSSPSGQ